ncbi:MAG: kelch repeat-containing protein [Bacteroidota bacterium]
MKRFHISKVLICLLGLFFLLSCSSDSENEMTVNDQSQDEQNGGSDDDGPTGDDTPQFNGFDINFTRGDFWEFYWFTENVNVAQGNVSTNTDNGRFRVTLGESQVIGGIEAYTVEVTGTNLEAYAGPRWSYLAVSENRLFGSTDGSTLDTIFNAQEGRWNGGGFFANFDQDATINAFDKEIDNEFIATNAIAASYQDGQTICEIIAGERICANDNSFNLLVNDFFKSGIGPVGYDFSRNVFDQGGGFTTTSEFRFEIGLVATSFSANDGFSPTLPPWMEKTTLPEPFRMTTVSSWDGKLYIFGGLDIDNNNSQQIYGYDPEADIWTQIGQTPVDLTYQIQDGFSTIPLIYEAFVINDKIYIVRTLGPETNAILIYDPLTNSWQPGPDLNINVAGKQCYMEAIDDNILFFPNQPNRNGEVWILNTTTNRWSSGNTSPWPHLSRSTVSAFDNKIYFSGNFRSGVGVFETRVRVYDYSIPAGEDGAWTETFFTGDGRASASSQVVNGRLYVMGGDNFGPEKRDVEEYVIAQDSWKTVGSMLNARASFLSVVINDKIYAIDLGSDEKFSIEEYNPALDRKSQ